MVQIGIELYSLLFCLVFVGIFYFKYVKFHNNMSSKLFSIIIIEIVILSIIKIISLSITSNLIILDILDSLITLLLPIVFIIYMLYDYVLGYKNSKKFPNYIQIFLIVYAIICTILTFSRFILKNTFDLNNIILFISMLPIIILIFEIFISKIKLEKEIFSCFLILLFNSFISMFSKNFNFITMSYTFCIFILYIYKVNNNLNTDALTGVYNRYMFERQLDCFNFISNELIGVFLIDVDKFKLINDKYGHLYGDNVLKDLAQILKKSVKEEDYVMRIGGDEFVIISKLESKKEMDKIINNINNNIDIYNNRNKSKLSLSVSIGYDYYDGKGDFKKLVDHIDKKMYLKKHK